MYQKSKSFVIFRHSFDGLLLFFRAGKEEMGLAMHNFQKAFVRHLIVNSFCCTQIKHNFIFKKKHTQRTS